MPTRRLAAVLFADIVGYTAMMQQNETEGMAKAQTFRSQVPQLVQTHQGEVIEIKGDGALCIFNSAAEATACAQQIQVELGADIPLRIGIHLGDVMQQSDHIMGDAVNIASRIESIGVAGAVLLSSSIRQQIKNKPEFDLVSLGKFAFKNVAEPMTVYALGNERMVVPDPKEVRGKAERVQAKEAPGLTAKSIIRLASIGFVAMVIGATLFWVGGWANERRNAEVQLLDKGIREEKLAVSVFQNFTGDKSLDALGYLGSEWISSGFRELNIRTVSPEMVRLNKETIGILPDNPQGKPSFIEITGAKYVITGSYFMQEDSIILNTRLSSTETGEEIYNFPKLVGHKDQKEVLVEEARQYLLGYWVLKKNQKLPNISPPKYEAYQIYMTCLLNQPDCYQKALEIDPDLMLARTWLMYVAVRYSDDSMYVTNKTYMEERWEQCTAFERNLFLFASNMWEGDFQAAIDAIDANYQLDSTDYVLTHVSGRIMLDALNQPQKAAKRFQGIFNKISLFERKIHGVSYYKYMSSLNRMGSFQEASDFFAHLSEDQKKEYGGFMRGSLIVSFIYQDRIEELKQLISQWGDHNENLVEAVYYYACIYPEAGKNPFSEELRKKMMVPWEYNRNRLGMESKTIAHYVLKEWEAAADSLLNLKRRNENQSIPNPWLEREIEAMLGTIYAHQEKREAALQQLEKVKKLGAQYFDQSHANLVRGTTSYYMARIHAVLGDKTKAVELLQLSINQGLFITDDQCAMDPGFVNLKDYPPFEELIRPKG